MDSIRVNKLLNSQEKHLAYGLIAEGKLIKSTLEGESEIGVCDLVKGCIARNPVPSTPSAIFTAKVVSGRNHQQVTFKTLDDLCTEVENEWPVLRQCDYSLQLKVPNNVLTPLTDMGILQLFPAENFIVVKKNLTGFSKVTKEKATAELGSVLDDTAQEHIKPIASIQPNFIEDDHIIEAANAISRDLLVRMKVLHTNMVSEYTKREFISPILIYAIHLVIEKLHANKNMKPLLLVCEKEILGKRFHGPVDYSLMYEVVDIVLTEAKRIDLEQGILQNLLQQLASQEFLASATVNDTSNRKRYREEVELNYKDISRMPTYGIVSTGEQWTFLKFYHLPEKKIFRSEVYQITLQHSYASEHKQAFVDSIAVLLRYIIGMIYDQIQWIDTNEGFWKKQKIDLEGILHRESTISSHVEDDDDNIELSEK